MATDYGGLTREDLIAALDQMGQEYARKINVIKQKNIQLTDLQGRIAELTDSLIETKRELRGTLRLRAINLKVSTALASAWLDTIDYLRELD